MLGTPLSPLRSRVRIQVSTSEAHNQHRGCTACRHLTPQDFLQRRHAACGRAKRNLSEAPSESRYGRCPQPRCAGDLVGKLCSWYRILYNQAGQGASEQMCAVCCCWETLTACNTHSSACNTHSSAYQGEAHLQALCVCWRQALRGGHRSCRERWRVGWQKQHTQLSSPGHSKASFCRRQRAHRCSTSGAGSVLQSQVGESFVINGLASCGLSLCDKQVPVIGGGVVLSTTLFLLSRR